MPLPVALGQVDQHRDQDQQDQHYDHNRRDDYGCIGLEGEKMRIHNPRLHVRMKLRSRTEQNGGGI
jgi:hypothetical protein